MISFIRGKLESKGTDYVVVDVGGVGFNITVPVGTAQELGDMGQEVTLYTYLNVRDDNLSLYGFKSREELYILEMLLKVSGVGPKVAMSILSTLSPSGFSLGVITADTKALTKAPGVGTKTAQRIILELKDRLSKDKDALLQEDLGDSVVTGGNKEKEAADALMVLGYRGKDALNAVRAVYDEDLTLEDIIKKALGRLF